MILVPTPARRAASSRGFSLLDLLAGMTVLAIAVMSQVGSTLSSHRLLVSESVRTAALDVIHQSLARLRSDEDWGTLYARLHLRETLAANGHAPLLFLDGEGAWPPASYFPGFVPPAELQDLGLLVTVPAPRPANDDVAADPVLREDVSDPAFGLPADLNTDGVIDGESRNADYEMLPVILQIRWRGPQGGVVESRLTTWLRGER